MTSLDTIESEPHLPPNISVLSVEDLQDTTVDVIKDLRRRGARVDEADTYEKATSLLRAQRYDVVLADLRIPSDEVRSVEAGVQLLRDLRVGKIGPSNRSTPYALLTAYPFDVDLVEMEKLGGFCGVIRKSGPVFDDLYAAIKRIPRESGRILPWFEAVQPPHDRRVVDDLLIVDGKANNKGLVRVRIGAWPHGDEAWVAISDLPAEILQELDYDVWPVYLWAKVNIAAESEAELKLHDFRLSMGDNTYGAEFDRGVDSPLPRRDWGSDT